MRLYPTSREEADRIKEDYEFLGIDVRFDGDALVVGSPIKRKKKQKDDKKPRRREARD